MSKDAAELSLNEQIMEYDVPVQWKDLAQVLMDIACHSYVHQ